MAGIADASPDAEKTRKTLVDGIVKAQEADGSWPVAGQFMGQQRPADEATEDAAHWTLWALASVPKLSADAESAVSKARTFVDAAIAKQSDADVKSNETLLLRAVYAHQQGDAARSRELVEQLLQQQHDDGGWSWVKATADSSPFATGQIVYGLRYLGRDAADPAVTRAVGYLLKSQGDDGVWKISNKTISASKKPDTTQGDAVYTYWATVWSVVGLLQTLPN